MASLNEIMKAKAAAMALTQKSEVVANSGIAMASEIATLDCGVDDYGVAMTAESGQIAAYAGDDGSWTQHKSYKYYSDYYDDNLSLIDDEKNIKLNEKQINITQEINAQYIPFEMSRKYDGSDFTKKSIQIYFVNSEGDWAYADPINVTYNNTKIRFGWLVDERVTYLPGKVKFEIHATGTNSQGDAYTWKTKSKELNVLESISHNSEIVIEDDWLEDIITSVVDAVVREEIDDRVSEAESAASRAESAAASASSAATTAATTAANKAVTSALKDYDTSAEVDEKIADISDKLKNYALKKDIPTVPTNVSAFTNDAGYLTKHQSLEGYATKKFVQEEIEKVDVSDQLVDYATKKFVQEEIEKVDVSDQLVNYATKKFVQEEIEKVDISNELGDLVDTNGDKLTVEKYVKQEVGNVRNDLSNYATINSLNDVKKSLESVSSNTITNAENITKAQNDIIAIHSTLNSLEGDNKDLIIQYDEVGSVLHLYERNENGDIVITDGDEQIKVKEVYSTIITGAGGGGGSLVSTVKLSLRTDGEDSSTILYGDNASLNYNLSTRKAKVTQDETGNDVTVYEEAVIAGDITLTLYKDNVYVTHFTITKTSPEVQSGSIDVSDYISLGKQVFTVTASYVEHLGSDGETITIRSSDDWAINAVNLKISNLPDSTWETTPKYGNTTFSYTPIGDVEKTIYFKIDDKKPETVVTSLNGTALTYTIPKQTHGVHTFQVWCEGNIGGTIVKTEPYTYILMFVEDGNNTPIIRIKAPTTLEQYSSTNIYYNVFDPLNDIIDSVTIYDEDGTILSSVENITSAEQKFEFRPAVVKNKTITIQYMETTESVEIEVLKFPYDISAVTGSLMVDFVPTGRTNSDVDYNVFKNNAYTVEKDANTGKEIQKEIPMTWTFSDNFDWVNGGWKRDTDGSTYFCVKAGTSVDINYNLFGTDGVIAKTDANGQYTIAGTGKEFKLIFKTTNVAKADATWLQCVDVADKKSLGIRMETQNAYIDSGLGTLEIPYVDDDIIEFDMNIFPITKFLENGEPNLKVKAIPMVITYEDGTPVQPKVINSASTSFKQDNPKPISIGSEYCDVHIYRMKVYERYLDDKEIITNYIADARSGADMAKRYLKNDIYPIEDRQRITPESVAAACPDLKVYILSAPYFTNDKGDKVSNTTIKQIHNTGTKEKPEYDITENWTATNAIHNGQGTSSNEYGYSGRNLEFNMKKATITLRDNTTVVKEIQLSPTSYPTNYLNFKINIASSENTNNSLLQKRYDRYLPYTTVASLIDSRKKNSMEFFNCVVFIQETDEDISKHREFSDTDIHFYGIGNIGDSKKTDFTRVNDPDDVNEFCVEIMDWNRYLSSFPTDTMISTLYTDYVDGEEVKVLRFEDLLVDTNLGKNGILYEKDAQGNYYHSTDKTVDKTKTYYIDILENDDFSEDYTYGFRYIQSEWDEEDGSDYKEKNEAFQKPLRQKWIEFYRFVTRDLTTNGVEDAKKVKAWKAEFSNWFIFDAALYYYLYTLRYTMVDNRAKNTFWHWGKHYLTFEEAIARGIAVYDEDKNLITDSSNLPSKFYDVNGNEIKNINAEQAAINDGYRMDFWDYDNDTALGIDNAGKLEIPFGVEDADVDPAGVPYFRAHDSLVFVRIAKYFAEELETAWHNTEINPVGKVFDSISFINEFDAWQNEFPEELWRLDYERKYKRTYAGGTGSEWDNALPQSNKSDIVSERFLTEMMNGRKKYQRRCFERNQEIYMSSKFKGEVNLSDTITLRGTGKPTNKVVSPNFTINVVPFSKMYVNLYSATDKVYYNERHEAGEQVRVSYPETTLDFIYIRGASQMQSLGDLSPMYLQTAELTSGQKLKTITLGNSTDGYSNDSLKTLQIGAGNKLLEELDIRNLSNLSNTNLPVSNIPSLKRVYAQGSNISEAVFANNGLLEEAYLPETITRLELRNLYYLRTINLESYKNLLHLVVINCSDEVNSLVLDIINQSPDLRTLRATNVNWNLENTDVLKRLYSLIKTLSSPEVVLSGEVYVPTIGQQELKEYNNVWPDLKINHTTLIEQFPVTFVNDDGTVLYVQYVDKGSDALDPVEEGLISKPTKKSTVSTDFNYIGWDDPSKLINIRNPITLKATYKETIRKYEVQYIVNLGNVENVWYRNTGDYGTNVPYVGERPTYTLGESGELFYWFDRWDKSGIITEAKITNGVVKIYAIFDSCKYENGYFNGKELKNLRPVEIYMLIRMDEISPSLNLLSVDSSGFITEDSVIQAGDPFSFKMGHDVEYSDITSVEIISDKTYFDGTNYIDTGITLFDEDKDFVLAVDYRFVSGCQFGGVLAECYRQGTDEGFRLSLDEKDANITWSGSESKLTSINNREMLIIRHKKNDKYLYIYNSNLNQNAVQTIELKTDEETIISYSLVFGAAQQTIGRYTSNATGYIYWAKLWYTDLGDDVCKKLALWTREDMTFEVCGINRYFINTENNIDALSSFSLLASHLISKKKEINTISGTTGGWGATSLKEYLNDRFYQSIPDEIRALIKEVKVKSSIGDKSKNVIDTPCYIAIPSLSEMGFETNTEPYKNEGKRFDHITSDNPVIKKYEDGTAGKYWLRSPNAYNSSYYYAIEPDGTSNGYQTNNQDNGVLPLLSM